MSFALMALLLGPAEAWAEPSLRSLHRCEAKLRTPSGEQIVVPAWGASEKLAIEQSRRVARFLAAQDLAVDLIPGLLAVSEEGQLRLLDRVGYPMADLGVGVPGYEIMDSGCVLDAEGSTRKDHAWVAEWPAGQTESVARTDAAAAIEGARRRACLTDYQAGLDKVLRDISAAPQADRDGISIGGMQSAFGSLSVCLTRARPLLSAGLERWEGSEGDLVECSASMMTMEGEWRSAQAWASDPEWSAELALWELSAVQARLGLAESMDAALRAKPALRTMGVSSGAARLTRLASASQDLERAGLSCVGLPADHGQELVWMPSNVEVSESCGPFRAWSGRQILMDPGSSWTELRHRTCQQWVSRVLPDGDEVIARAPEGSVVSSALQHWEYLVHCAARCSSEVTRTASRDESALILAGQPELGDKTEVQARIRKAIEDRDAAQFEICVPAVASFRAVMVAQPERFWGDMEHLEGTGELYEIFGWEQYRGRWYLMPVE
jgi:hypothetical protein